MARRHAILIDHSHRFLGDTHFGHPLMIKPRAQKDGSVKPPFRVHASMQAHDDYLVDAWNQVVKPGMVAWHLGDFGYGKPDDLHRIFRRLNGEKHLLVGNHDDPDEVASKDFGWASVNFGPVHWKDSVSGLKVVGSHHPQREWDGWHKGAVHLHGHTHNTLPSSRRSLDVGVDSIGASPLTFTQLQGFMRRLPELDFRGVETDPFVAGR